MLEGWGVGLRLAPPGALDPCPPVPGERPVRLTEVLGIDWWSPEAKAAELDRVQLLKGAVAAYEAALIESFTAARHVVHQQRPNDLEPGTPSWSAGGLEGVTEDTVDELAQVLRCSVTEASVRTEHALLLRRHLHRTWAALADGGIDWPRARAIAAELAEPAQHGDPALLPLVEAAVLPDAMQLGVKALRAAVRRQLLALDPAAAERRRTEARDSADVTVQPGADGMSAVVTRLPHQDAVAVREQADALARMLKTDGDPRPLGVLRAEVLRDLVLRPHDTSRPAVTGHVTVLAPLPTLQRAASAAPFGPFDTVLPGEVAGQPVTAAHLREVLEQLGALCPGGLQPPVGGSLDVALLDPDTGQLLATVTHHQLEQLVAQGCPRHPRGDCGCAVLGRPEPVERWRHTPAQQRFTGVRDRTCRMPGCHRPAGETDRDHVVPYHQGGPTDCTNLCCLCQRHHLLKTHAAGWTFVLDDDGVLTVTTPSGITRVSRPPGCLQPPESAGYDPPPF